MSQASAKPFICMDSFNPLHDPMTRGLLFHSFKLEKIETYGGIESCPRLYNLQLIVEFELEARPRLSVRPLTTVQTHLIRSDLKRTSTNHQMNAKVYWIRSEKQVASQHRIYIVH